MTAEVSHSFLLDGAVEWPEIATALGDLRLEFNTEDTSLSFRMLDCHDQLLRKSGRVLLEFGDRLTMLAARHATTASGHRRGGKVPRRSARGAGQAPDREDIPTALLPGDDQRHAPPKQPAGGG